MIRALLLFILLVFPQMAWATPEAAVDLSQDFIPVTEDFDGAHMMIFGALRQASSDVVVVLEGPKAQAMVREKVRRFGIWVNDEAQDVEDVPSFYAVLSSRPLTQGMDRWLVRKYGLDLDSLPLASKAGHGVKLNRMAKGLYLENDKGVRIRDRKLFRADIDLPPNVPVGVYKASIYEISSGRIIADRTTEFKIEQIGVNGWIKYMAHKRPVYYAVMCLVICLGVGFVSAHLFRKVSK